MKTAVIAFTFPAPSETFVLRHVQHFQADVVCGVFRPDLLSADNTVGRIEPVSVSTSSNAHKGPIHTFLSRVRGRVRRAIRPESVYAWNRAMHRHWSAYLDSHRPDVVLAEFAPNALGAMDECRRRSIPLVAHFHGFDASTLMRIDAYRRALPSLFEGAAAVICVSNPMRGVLLRAGCSPDKLHVIPCGAPVRDFKFSEHTGAQPCTFLAVSRLVQGKGPMVTLRAFHLAYSKRPDVRLIVAGDGPLRGEITRYVQKHALGQAVTILGSIPNRDVCKLMGTSTVFVQASLQDRHGWVEGWGVSLAEALATGLPAIVTRSGGMVDLVTDGYDGFLFEQGDWRTMADRMLQLADDSALRLRMGRAAREHVEKVGSTENSLRSLATVLQSAAGQAPIAGARTLASDGN